MGITVEIQVTVHEDGIFYSGPRGEAEVELTTEGDANILDLPWANIAGNVVPIAIARYWAKCDLEDEQEEDG